MTREDGHFPPEPGREATKGVGPRRWRKRVAMGVALGLMALGIGMICQPFVHAWFGWGFVVTLVGIGAFNVAVHLPEDGRG